MIKEYILIRVDCDICGSPYKSEKDVIHFQDQISANNTAFDEGWWIRKYDNKHFHVCPTCLKMCKDSNLSIQKVILKNSKQV